MNAQSWICCLIVAFFNLTVVTGNACDDKLNELTTNGSSSILSEACTAPDGTSSCPLGCREKLQELLTACDNQVFDFSLLVETIKCDDFNVCQTVTDDVYGAYSYLCPDDGSTSECRQPCVDILNALESACLEPDGYIPPEYFLDTQFGHPACKQIAFDKAIERSRGCGDWAEIQSVGFGNLCTDQCTSSCVAVIDNMFDQCDTLPGFVVENLVPLYNADCQAAFIANDITREIDNLGSYNCAEMVEFYGKASQYLCTAETLSLTVVGNNGLPQSAFPLGLCQGDCDDDSDCEHGLICFQRDSNVAVPGCSGGLDDASLSDYCIRPSSSPAVPLNLVGNNGIPASAFPLGLCQGDCDDDSNCEPGLVCFQRDSNVAVPGCSGGLDDASLSDYCIRPSSSPAVPLNVVGNNGIPASSFPLGLCQGDCDDDSNCEPGLVCFQRDSNVAVPGCSGGLDDSSLTDYCIRPSSFPVSTGDSVATCDPLCLNVLNALERACLQPDGYIAPEYFLDSKFGNPTCQEVAFSKAIQRSNGCGAWTEIQSVGFRELCSEECTENCVTVIENMFDQCETVPSFVVGLYPGYNADCRRTFECLDNPASCTRKLSISSTTAELNDSSSALPGLSFAMMLTVLVEACILLSIIID
ncbi:unnamed protein product [Cylindrotheca closterium]|uniref:Subtilisin n=1 Tax=Cylindrotheca closterium TaxID=2856 RepID=A0AAD2G7Q6_9STRA|nr:unnamed protein product [Cylindrotheca closterium]